MKIVQGFLKIYNRDLNKLLILTEESKELWTKFENYVMIRTKEKESGMSERIKRDTCVCY